MVRDPLPNLPQEIIFDILLRLPAKPLCRFLSISKPWHALITDRRFIKAHLQRQSNKLLILFSRTSPYSLYSMDLQTRTITQLPNPWKFPLEVFGSCNGVVLGLPVNEPLALWNPSTRKVKLISLARVSSIHAISYDSLNDDFKIIRFVMHTIEEPQAVHLYSSRSSSWRKLPQGFSYHFYTYTSYFGTRAVSLNGAPHWVVWRLEKGKRFGESLVVYFDPTSEKFEELPLPKLEETHPNKKHFELTVLGGKLCAVEKDTYEVGVWVMTKHVSWTRLFVVVLDQPCYHLTPLCYGVGDGEVIMGDRNTLVLYNLKENKVERIELPQGCECDPRLTACYMESIVSS